jgi:pimeloyl-ACP methyl ester carboxylesterase
MSGNPLNQKPQQTKLSQFTRWKLLTAFLAAIITLSACASKPADDKKKAEEAEKAAQVEPSGPPEEVFPPGMKGIGFEDISIPMKDHLLLYARLYVPGMTADDEEEAAKPEADGEEPKAKYPLVILLHGLNHTHKVWNDFPACLIKAGYAVLAVDLRGHGKSTRTKSGRRVTWRYFKPADWKHMPLDIAETVRFFDKSEDYPTVDGSNVALIGEKLGANVAVLATQKTRESVKTLTLISPGLDYKGLVPSAGLMDFNKPVLLLTSQDDEYGNKSTHGLYNWILAQKTLMEYGRIGDGADMLLGKPAIEAAIVDWLKKAVPSGAAPAEPAVKASAEPTVEPVAEKFEKPAVEAPVEKTAKAP